MAIKGSVEELPLSMVGGECSGDWFDFLSGKTLDITMRSFF